MNRAEEVREEKQSVSARNVYSERSLISINSQVYHTLCYLWELGFIVILEQETAYKTQSWSHLTTKVSPEIHGIRLLKSKQKPVV